MQDHTIICRNCNTRVARTPNQVCVKCKAPKWGYTDAQLSGNAPIQPPVTPRPPVQPQVQNQAWNTNQNQAANPNAGVTKLICKNCKTLVARTPDHKCVNCGKLNWGYTAGGLKRLDGTSGGGASLPPVSKKILIGASALVVLIGLGFLIWKMSSPKTNIYDKYSKSVVMLYSEYLYTFNINGSTIYFNYDEEKNALSNITLNRDSAATMGLYGTGFFIDKEGRIVTNRHVVHHLSVADETACRNEFRAELQKEITDYSNLKDSAAFHISNLSILATHAFDSGDSTEASNDISTRNKWMQLQSDADKKIRTYQAFINGMPDAKFGVDILYLGYAVDGTTVSKKSDYKACHLLDYSTDQAVDLALIQSNDHRLPEGTTNFVSVDDLSAEPLKVGDDVTLLGYNLGAEIGVTQTGLHVQKIDGKISQESDNNKVLYSINSLPGSSGSPVFSSNGKLVAVNFAGINQTSGYNYGILASHIQEVIKNQYSSQ